MASGGRAMTQDQVAVYFRKYGPMVLRRARIILGNQEDAEDATQEVFLRAIASIGRFEQRSEVSTWLYRITTNHCVDLLRSRKVRNAKIGSDAKEEEVLAGGPDVAEVLVLRSLISEADEREARAALYVHVDGMTHEEAAEVLGVSRRTVGNLIERFNRWARTRLASGLQVGGAEDPR